MRGKNSLIKNLHKKQLTKETQGKVSSWGWGKDSGEVGGGRTWEGREGLEGLGKDSGEVVVHVGIIEGGVVVVQEPLTN